MAHKQVQVVVAGHVCLDIIPEISRAEGGLEAVIAPGGLINVGPAVMATGGAVSNTGLTLHRLGVPTRLMGKIGNDRFGSVVLDILRSHDPTLAKGMIVTPGEHTSYTIVISLPGVDRTFLHCPGANDTFSADDVVYERLAGAKVFHFGYPPIMRGMFVNGGAELEKLLGRVKEMNLTVSLDMAKPDPSSEAGRTDWPALLARVLPYVDLFAPSLDEILFMLDRRRFEEMSSVDGNLLGEISQRLIDYGAAIVMLKLGADGLYVRTTADRARLKAAGAAAPSEADAWVAREMLAPCFKVDVMGATGSGDSTIAGFLAAMLHGQDPVQATTTAVAVGACNVEQPDAISGIGSWDEVQQRIKAGWLRREVGLNLNGWSGDDETAVRFGPHDVTNS